SSRCPAPWTWRRSATPASRACSRPRGRSSSSPGAVMRPLAIVDYGMGNLRSVAKAFERVGQAAEVTRDPERIAGAPGVVLPGAAPRGHRGRRLRLLRALLLPRPGRCRARRDRDAVRGGVRLERGAGQRVRLSVPPREEPGGGTPPARELRAGGARPVMIVYPAIDARGGRVRVAGWTEAEDLDAVTAAGRAAGMGAAAVVYTDVERDGTELGPDLAGTRAVARAAGLPVIASGGIGSLDHLRAVAALG